MTEVDLQKEIRKIIVQELIPDMKIFETNTLKDFFKIYHLTLVTVMKLKLLIKTFRAAL